MNKDHMYYALFLIRRERERQELLKEDGVFRHTLADMGMQEPEKLACITEEVGEISRNVLTRAHLTTDGDLGDAALLSELTQVAALACAWMERLVSNTPEHTRRLTPMLAPDDVVKEVADLVRHRPGDTDEKYTLRAAAIHEAAIGKSRREGILDSDTEIATTQQEDKGGAEKDRRDPHMPRRREYRTGAELTKMGIADRREYLRRKDDRPHRSA